MRVFWRYVDSSCKCRPDRMLASEMANYSGYLRNFYECFRYLLQLFVEWGDRAVTISVIGLFLFMHPSLCRSVCLSVCLIALSATPTPHPLLCVVHIWLMCSNWNRAYISVVSTADRITHMPQFSVTGITRGRLFSSRGTIMQILQWQISD